MKRSRSYSTTASKGMGRVWRSIGLTLDIIAAAGMILTGYSFLIDPARWPYAAVAGMFFPFFAAATLLLIVLWLFLKPRLSLLPILAMIVCYQPVRMYVGIVPEKSVPDGAIKVMSYNVLDFVGMENNRLPWHDNPLVFYLIDTDADVLCLQECGRDHLAADMKTLLKEKYPYQHYAEQGKGGTSLAVYSKHPIVRVDSIACDTSRCRSLAYTIALPGIEAMVVNNHFESNKFGDGGKKDFRKVMHGKMQRDSAAVASKYIFSRFAEKAVLRSAQTKAVAQFLNERKDVPTILCGDFNDMPISANYHRIARLLDDCFRAAGFGFGWTYCHDGMRVRIDNIFCSRHFVPYSCKVLSDPDYSDHRPVVCYLGLKE
ncbi:MAG: endonuclease/exonuclease/phosphatase family protein [Prevotella sp.]|nr:endonuclease/exonuclease/phosphatase family protein [Prevotella sp.]